jgi:hypothetical protein
MCIYVFEKCLCRRNYLYVDVCQDTFCSHFSKVSKVNHCLRRRNYLYRIFTSAKTPFYSHSENRTLVFLSMWEPISRKLPISRKCLSRRNYLYRIFTSAKTPFYSHSENRTLVSFRCGNLFHETVFTDVIIYM